LTALKRLEHDEERVNREKMEEDAPIRWGATRPEIRVRRKDDNGGVQIVDHCSYAKDD
jgi:hypothetical protein